MPKCYYCEKELTEDYYCYGCKEHICEDCDETGASGNHSIEDHKLGG